MANPRRCRAEHVVLTKGDLSGEAPVLARVHTLNPLEDVLGIGAGHVAVVGGGRRTSLAVTESRPVADQALARPHATRQGLSRCSEP